MNKPEHKTEFSPCRRYRYTLWREWPKESFDMFDGCNDGERGSDNRHEYLMVIGLNPSTADETRNDPTIRRCIDFAKRWGFGALCMTNLFAWRDTKPENMKRAEYPIGEENDFWLGACALNAGLVLAAWGKNGSHLNRASQVQQDFKSCGFKMHALKTNRDGSPMHPLYVPAETPLILL